MRRIWHYPKTIITAIAAVVAVLFLSGCGGDTPQQTKPVETTTTSTTTTKSVTDLVSEGGKIGPPDAKFSVTFSTPGSVRVERDKNGYYTRYTSRNQGNPNTASQWVEVKPYSEKAWEALHGFKNPTSIVFQGNAALSYSDMRHSNVGQLVVLHNGKIYHFNDDSDATRKSFLDSVRFTS